MLPIKKGIFQISSEITGSEIVDFKKQLNWEIYINSILVGLNFKIIVQVYFYLFVILSKKWKARPNQYYVSPIIVPSTLQ